MKGFLNEMNRIKKPRPPAIDTTNMDTEDIKELLKNGTLNLEDFLKGNKTVSQDEKKED